MCTISVSKRSGDDLTVSFTIRRRDPGEIRSLSLLCTPKYEFILDESERGVHVSDEDSEQDDGDSLDAIEFHGEEVLIVCRGSEYRLDCNNVDPEEVEEAKKILHAMNFDKSFSLRIH